MENILWTKKLTWEERRDIAEKTMTRKEFHGYKDENGYWSGFGYISPFTEPMIHHWLDYYNIPRYVISYFHYDSLDPHKLICF